ncbi:MAG: HEAT repeat domain-containing protein [Planctomycetales bacterium]
MNLFSFAADYLARMLDDENAVHALVEAPHAIIPILASAFRSEPDPLKRSIILHVIWQHRDPSAIPFLAEGLQDRSPQVWKEALDGLVTIGGPESLAAINGTSDRHFESESVRQTFREFLVEALEQLNAGRAG